MVMDSEPVFSIWSVGKWEAVPQICKKITEAPRYYQHLPTIYEYKYEKYGSHSYNSHEYAPSVAI